MKIYYAKKNGKKAKLVEQGAPNFSVIGQNRI